MLISIQNYTFVRQVAVMRSYDQFIAEKFDIFLLELVMLKRAHY